MNGPEIDSTAVGPGTHCRIGDLRTMHSLGRFLRDERAQSTTEFVLLVSLISVPLYFGIREFMDVFLRKFITSVVENFTKG